MTMVRSSLRGRQKPRIPFETCALAATVRYQETAVSTNGENQAALIYYLRSVTL